jgi:Zn-dependent peptidase ImmA (M78 family)
MKLAKEFIKFTVKELGIQSLPTDIKFVDDDYSVQHATFGTYNPTTNEIVIVKSNRHPVDVLRTLAHELVHHKQREDGVKLDGNDGSDTENEANAKAGELMRKFRTAIPEIFNVGPWGMHTNMENKLHKLKSIEETGVPEQIEEEYIDRFTARLLVETANDLSPKNRTKFLSEPVSNMVKIAYKIITH